MAISDEGRRRMSEAAKNQMSDPAARAKLSALHKNQPNLGAHNTNHRNRGVDKSGCPWCDAGRDSEATGRMRIRDRTATNLRTNLIPKVGQPEVDQTW